MLPYLASTSVPRAAQAIASVELPHSTAGGTGLMLRGFLKNGKGHGEEACQKVTSM